MDLPAYAHAAEGLEKVTLRVPLKAPLSVPLRV